ncbi:MAG: hypothetical protein KGI45_01710 [Patescibacteria group bacterium]|nr:hypothetical protein [Patescibacteria group bacterium]MDE1941280.1 hypothetical protein [Patescibacteria group bacterium]MDE1966773.1 hypothetical protein [Patescibacteria group bacterium]
MYKSISAIATAALIASTAIGSAAYAQTSSSVSDPYGSSSSPTPTVTASPTATASPAATGYSSSLYGTSGSSSASSSMTGSSTRSGTTSSSSTVPGAPNTGAGGDVATNIAILMASAVAAIGGTTYLIRRRYAAEAE